MIMRYSKFGIYIVAAIVAAMTVSRMAVSCDSTTQAENGHDYDWEMMRSTALRHSPKCRKCKEMRKQEVIEIVDSILRDRIKQHEE